MDERVAVKNNADPEQVRKAKLKDNIRERDKLEDLRAVLKTPEGRNVIWDLLKKCSIFEHGPGGGRSEELHFFEGHRHIGLLLWNQILAADPQALIKMQEHGVRLEMMRQEANRGR